MWTSWLERTTGEGAGNEDWEERGESGSGQYWGAQSWLGLLPVGMRGLRDSPGVLPALRVVLLVA